MAHSPLASQTWKRVQVSERSQALSDSRSRARLRAVRLRTLSGIVGVCLLLATLGACGHDDTTSRPPPAPEPAPAASDTFHLPPAAESVATRPVFDFEGRVGVARGSGESLICLEIANPKLSPGDLVTLVSPLNRAFPAAARVISSAGDSCAGASSDPGASHYTLRLIQGVFDTDDIAIAIVGEVPTPHLRGGIMTVDLDGDGQLESFHECASQEGVHLTLWTGDPPSGERRWHRYLPMKMDLTPNCTEAETMPPRAEGP